MTMPLTVTLSSNISERVKRLADLQQQDVVEVIEAALDDALSWRDIGSVSVEAHDANEGLTPEMQAYIALHPQLKERYLGQYVAIYKGQLVDHDQDHAALYARIDAQYPDEFVWISPVEEEPIPTLVFRSPRLERNEPA